MTEFKEWAKLMIACLACLFGHHAPGVYKGKIKITHIDRATHKIEYGNVKECPNCGKAVSVDFW